MINIKDIEEKAKEYGLTCQCYNNVVYIQSKYNNWYAEIVSNNHIVLHHQNRDRNKSQYHKQRDYKDFDFMFKSIREHDEYKIGRRSFYNSRIGKLYKQISC